MFPAVDPIPLPAPIWLFKLLHVVTLALHFTAMQMLVGSLVAASLWAILGRLHGDKTLTAASGSVISRLPVVMTYVINFGVPPLLFAQVLYGRAIYTSSVLIGWYWISVILILTFAYWFLYVASGRAEKGKGWGFIGLLSAVMILGIGGIYSNNMTLMLRPKVWAEMYAANAHGTQLNPGDPTLIPRYLFFMVGSLAVGGAAMMLLSLKKSLADGVNEFLGAWGGRLVAVGIIGQVALGFWVMKVQPEGVAAALGENKIYVVAEIAWLATAALMLALGGLAGVSATGRKVLPVAGACLVTFLNIASMTLVRDGIRDVTLRLNGYEVWDRVVVTNWSVVGLFLVLFVAGLGIAGWMIAIMAGARQEKECYV